MKTVFWRVRQKPGKPIFFGVRGKRLAFGLPGNPASAFTCFYIYVYPALRQLAGFRHPDLPRTVLKLANDVKPDPKRWILLKARTRSGSDPSVTRLPKQGSHMITSLAETDSFIVVPSASDHVGGGNDVTAQLEICP